MHMYVLFACVCVFVAFFSIFGHNSVRHNLNASGLRHLHLPASCLRAASGTDCKVQLQYK